jgi:hypothetical protein
MTNGGWGLDVMPCRKSEIAREESPGARNTCRKDHSTAEPSEDALERLRVRVGFIDKRQDNVMSEVKMSRASSLVFGVDLV